MTSLFWIALALAPTAPAQGWLAGTGRAAITPRVSTWMAGYAARTKPSEGKDHDLWAKALALRDPGGKTAVLVTIDVCGIGREVSDAVRDAAKARHGLDRDRIVLACSHTHSGPVVGSNLITMYRLDDEQKRRVDEYTKALIGSLGEVVAAAIETLEPATISWGTGRADFAVNRRANKEADVPALRESLGLKGPVDHDVPVLLVASAEGVKAIVCGYACHGTTLDGHTFSGDYAGYAAIELESAHRGAQAMFVAGCGADQNPIPRRSPELAEAYGTALAAAVERVLEGALRPVDGPLGSAYEEVPLRFATLPTKAEIEESAKSKDFIVAGRARSLLGQLDSKGALDPTYPYPVQAWRLGELTWIFLGGEVVVDYSLRLKRNLGSSKTWVSAYANDVMAYIPSVRVLKEGGYEGGGAMLYYGLPAPWAESVEDDVIAAVARQVREVDPER